MNQKRDFQDDWFVDLAEDAKRGVVAGVGAYFSALRELSDADTADKKYAAEARVGEAERNLESRRIDAMIRKEQGVDIRQENRFAQADRDKAEEVDREKKEFKEKVEIVAKAMDITEEEAASMLILDRKPTETEEFKAMVDYLTGKEKPGGGAFTEADAVQTALKVTGAGKQGANKLTIDEKLAAWDKVKENYPEDVQKDVSLLIALGKTPVKSDLEVDDSKSWGDDAFAELDPEGKIGLADKASIIDRAGNLGERGVREAMLRASIDLALKLIAGGEEGNIADAVFDRIEEAGVSKHFVKYRPVIENMMTNITGKANRESFTDIADRVIGRAAALPGGLEGDAGQREVLDFIVTNGVAKLDSVATKRDLSAAQQGLIGMENIRKLMTDLHDADAIKFNRFAGLVEKHVRRGLGLTTDPEYIEFQTQIEIVKQNYARAQSGLTLTEREQENMDQMFPDYLQSFEVGDARASGLIIGFQRQADRVVGGNLIGNANLHLFSPENIQRSYRLFQAPVSVPPTLESWNDDKGVSASEKMSARVGDGNLDSATIKPDDSTTGESVGDGSGESVETQTDDGEDWVVNEPVGKEDLGTVISQLKEMKDRGEDWEAAFRSFIKDKNLTTEGGYTDEAVIKGIIDILRAELEGDK